MQDRKNLQPTLFAMHCSWSNLMMQGGTAGWALRLRLQGPQTHAPVIRCNQTLRCTPSAVEVLQITHLGPSHAAPSLLTPRQPCKKPTTGAGWQGAAGW